MPQQKILGSLGPHNPGSLEAFKDRPLRCLPHGRRVLAAPALVSASEMNEYRVTKEEREREAEWFIGHGKRWT